MFQPAGTYLLAKFKGWKYLNYLKKQIENDFFFFEGLEASNRWGIHAVRKIPTNRGIFSIFSIRIK